MICVRGFETYYSKKECRPRKENGFYLGYGVIFPVNCSKVLAFCSRLSFSLFLLSSFFNLGTIQCKTSLALVNIGKLVF